MTLAEDHVREFARDCVRAGLLSTDELHDEVVAAIRQDLPERAGEADGLATTWTDEAREQLRVDQESWPEATDYERLQSAFEELALDDVEVRVVESELQLRCPMLLRCYRDGTDPRTSDGWFPTGDLGVVDEHGLVSVHGRKGDLIITGGENVWPEPVEAILREHPAVADVAVAGTPDDEWGQLVTAYVDGEATADERALVEAELSIATLARMLAPGA